jgi:hypothetical protein
MKTEGSLPPCCIKTVILPVVLYGCETWSLTLREEHRLMVFEKRVLRIFGPKREEDGSWRKLHNDELHSMYSSPNIVKFVPVLNLAPRHEDVWRSGGIALLIFLISALDGGEWSASCPDRFTPRERAHSAHWIGDWVGPRAGLDPVM